MSAIDMAIDEWVQRIRKEYRENPGLRLTGPQAVRLWGLEPRTCNAILTELVATGFLERVSGDMFVRAARD
jgi:Fic family protein